MKRLNAFALMVMLPLAGLSVEASAADCSKGKIKIYTSWPLQGAMLPEGTGMKNGVDLAVDQNKSEAAGYCLEVVNLDDASPQTGKWDGAAPGEPDMYRPLGIVSYFRVPPADDIQGSVGARWAQKLGHKKVYILNDQELYGKGIADVFEAEAKKIGLEVLGNEGIDYKQPDQKPVLTKIR